MGNKPRSFEEWVEQVPESLRQDPLWTFDVYPKALFAIWCGRIVSIC